jgi:hypothetical protein
MSHNYEYDRDVLRKLIKHPYAHSLEYMGRETLRSKCLPNSNNEGIEYLLAIDYYAYIPPSALTSVLKRR